MNPSMINATISMSGLQMKLDILSNNIANMNTVGFKKQTASFQDILTSFRDQHEDFELPGRRTPLGAADGWGMRMTDPQIDMTQGPLQSTDNPLDLAIDGNALFEINLPQLNNEGQPVLDEAGAIVFDRAWTRNGAFQLTTRPGDNGNGYLATAEGHLLRGTNNDFIRIPNNSTMVINTNGTVFSVDMEGESTQVGQLQIVRVDRPQQLENIGDNLFALPGGIDNPDDILQPLDDLEASEIAVRQGFLERSNVNLASEMVELMAAQRAYQLSARALSSSDTMMNLANQLRG